MADQSDESVPPGPDDERAGAPPRAWAPPSAPAEAQPPRLGIRTTGGAAAPAQPAPLGSGAAAPAAPPLGAGSAVPAQSPPASAAGYVPPPKPGLIPLFPLTFGRLLGAAFATIRWNPRAVIAPAVVLLLIQQLLVTVGTQSLLASSIAQLTSLTATGDPDLGALGPLAAGLGVRSALVLVVGTAIAAVVDALLQGMIVVVAAEGALGRRPAFRAVLRRAGRSYLPLLGFSALILGAFAVAILVLAGIVVALSLLGLGGVVAAVILGILGLVGLVVLAVWIEVRVLVAPSVIVLEHAGVRTAIARSWRLTRGSFWRSLGLQVLVGLIVGAISRIVATPFALLGGLLTTVLFPNGLDDPTALANASIVTGLPGTVIGGIVAGIGTIAQVAALALLYLDLRMRREGLDLRLRRVAESGDTATDPFAAPAS